MGVDYSFQGGYGFAVPESFESEHEEEIGEDGLWEYMESLFFSWGNYKAEFPLLGSVSCGSMGWTGEGQIAVVVKRTKKHFYIEDEFKEFADFEAGHTDEELAQLSAAAKKFEFLGSYRWLAGINVS